MKTVLLTIASSLLFLAPATAQVMGSVNRKAPTCMSAIMFADGGKVSVEFRSISRAEGEWQKGVENERMRQFINKNADQNPIGKLTVSGTSIVFGGKEIGEGTYSIRFHIGEDLEWTMLLASKDGETEYEWKLPLEKMDDLSQRLRLRVQAGEEDNELECYIALANKCCLIDGHKVTSE